MTPDSVLTAAPSLSLINLKLHLNLLLKLHPRLSLFSSPQYILEIQPEDHEKPSRYEWLDEGRMEVAENPAREIDPETVKGEKPGSGFAPDFLPEPALF